MQVKKQNIINHEPHEKSRKKTNTFHHEAHEGHEGLPAGGVIND
jgi:hypothetical protein